MSAVMLQVVIMVTVFGSLLWLATRRSRTRGVQRRSGDSSWSSDAVYSIADAGQHDGSGVTDSGAGGSGDSGGGDSGGGGGDGGGGGSSD
jgi:uncharacterized membrane protein YgcG